ncbi:unnamed protein product, partial [Coregonus sp. 'balchen']
IVVIALLKRQGHFYSCDGDVKGRVAFTIFNCRFNKDLLRRFCSAAGYGWDYPDNEFRDITLYIPISVTAQFKKPLLVPGIVTIKF